MASSITARDSKDLLYAFLADLLKDELGTFSLTGEPAIWIEPPFLNEKMKPKGLAVFINRYEMMRQQRTAGLQALQLFDWRVVLRTYDKSSTGMNVMDRAKLKIEQSFPVHRQRNLETKESAYPQITFLLDTARVINLVR